MGMSAVLQRVDKSELAVLRERPQTIEEWLFEESQTLPKRHVDLDKAWHALHFLLTGNLEPDGTPIGDAILGGDPIGPDLGYGPARVISADYAKEIHQAIDSIDIEAAYSKLDPDAAQLSMVYCGFEFDPEEVTYLADYFNQLKAFYADAAQHEQAIIAYIV